MADEDVLMVPCCEVQTVLRELAKVNFTPQRWHVGNRNGHVVWSHGANNGMRLIWLTPEAATSLATGDHSCDRCAALLGSGAAWLSKAAHPRPESAFVSACSLEKLQPGTLPSIRMVLSFIAAERGSEHQGFTFAELFAGIGGFRLGLEAVGGRCVLANEWDPLCCKTYAHNFGESDGGALHPGDVCGLNFAAWSGVDLLCGGFPCQPFSGLGPQDGLHDPRGRLFLEIVRFLREASPRAFLLENVPGLLTSEEGRSMEHIASALRATGYSVTWKVVSAAPLTAQRRRRLYIVGFRDVSADGFGFPTLPELGLASGDVEDAEAKDAGATLFPAQLDALKAACSRRGLHEVLCWPDQKAAPIVSHYGHHVSNGASQLRPQAAPRLPRLFSPREALRLMGFPEAFCVPEDVPAPDMSAPEAGGQEPRDSAAADKRILSAPATARSHYRMIGNAVCPPVIAAMAGTVVAHLAATETEQRLQRQASIRAAVALARCALPQRGASTHTS